MNIEQTKQEILEEFNKKWKTQTYKEIKGKDYLTTNGELTNIYWQSCGVEIESDLSQSLNKLQSVMLENLPEECIVQRLTPSQGGCNECGFPNDHRQCMCLFNQAIKQAREQLSK